MKLMTIGKKTHDVVLFCVVFCFLVFINPFPVHSIPLGSGSISAESETGKTAHRLTDHGIYTAIMQPEKILLKKNKDLLMAIKWGQNQVKKDYNRTELYKDSSLSVRVLNGFALVSIDTMNRMQGKEDFRFYSEHFFVSLQNKTINHLYFPYRTAGTLCTGSKGAPYLMVAEGFLNEHREARPAVFRVYKNKPAVYKLGKLKKSDEFSFDNILFNDTFLCKSPSSDRIKKRESVSWSKANFEYTKKKLLMKLSTYSIALPQAKITEKITHKEINIETIYQSIFNTIGQKPTKVFGLQGSRPESLYDFAREKMYIKLGLIVSASNKQIRRYYIKGNFLINTEGEILRFNHDQSIKDIWNRCYVTQTYYTQKFDRTCIE